jgi:poly(3-hydroxybutyrate) depolymerase
MKTINAIATVIALGLALGACTSETTTSPGDSLDGVGGSDPTDTTEVAPVGGSGVKTTTVVQFVEVPKVELSKCVPGAQTGCSCTDGSSGAQICQDDGTMGECVCEAPEGYSGECVKVGDVHVGATCPVDQPILYVNCAGKPAYNGGTGCLDAFNPGNGMWCCRT